MISENDINLYLEAKRQVRIAKKVTILCIAALVAWIFLKVLGFDGVYFDIAAIVIFTAGLVHADGGRYSSYVTKAKLLEVIERQINNDPEAIKYINKA